MKQIKYNEVIVIADCEGSSTKVLANFSSLIEANKFANSDQGRDMYGGKGVIKQVTLTIYDTAEEAGTVSILELRKSAAAKLTQAERNALGLS